MANNIPRASYRDTLNYIVSIIIFMEFLCWGSVNLKKQFLSTCEKRKKRFGSDDTFDTFEAESRRLLASLANMLRLLAFRRGDKAATRVPLP